MIKEGNKRIMINLSPEDLELLEGLSKKFHYTKSELIHFLLSGELQYFFATDTFNLELYYNQKVLH